MRKSFSMRTLRPVLRRDSKSGAASARFFIDAIDRVLKSVEEVRQ
jgi:hypothetical protein